MVSPIARCLIMTVVYHQHKPYVKDLVTEGKPTHQIGHFTHVSQLRRKCPSSVSPSLSPSAMPVEVYAGIPHRVSRVSQHTSEPLRGRG